MINENRSMKVLAPRSQVPVPTCTIYLDSKQPIKYKQSPITNRFRPIPARLSIDQKSLLCAFASLRAVLLRALCVSAVNNRTSVSRASPQRTQRTQSFFYVLNPDRKPSPVFRLSSPVSRFTDSPINHQPSRASPQRHRGHKGFLCSGP